MECAQVNITGGTGAKTPQTYTIPGIYKASDPGVLISIYGSMAGGYKIPGKTRSAYNKRLFSFADAVV